MKKVTKKVFWGLFWMAAGTILLLSNYGIISYHFSLVRDWPAILVLIGLTDMIESLT